MSKTETSISVPVDSVNKHNISEFLSPKLLVHDTEVRWAVKVALSHFSYRSNDSMKSSFLAIFPLNTDSM